MSIYLPSSAALNKKFMDWKLERGGVNRVTITQGMWPIIGRKLARSTSGIICLLQDMIELMHDVTLKTVMGQCLDTQCLTEDNRPKLEAFNMDRYNAIVKYKTSYYSFQLPVALAMYMVMYSN